MGIGRPAYAVMVPLGLGPGATVSIGVAIPHVDEEAGPAGTATVNASTDGAKEWLLIPDNDIWSAIVTTVVRTTTVWRNEHRRE